MAQNWNIDPQTGDYVMEGGAPQQTDSLKIPAYIRIKTRRNQWLYAPDSEYGSAISEIKKQAGNDNTKVENAISVALQPIVDDGRAEEINIETTVNKRFAVGVETKIITAEGSVQELNLESI